MSETGGCGKTTGVCNLAAVLALSGYSVLQLELNPQRDLAYSWGIDDDRNVVRLEQLLPGGLDPRAHAIDVTPDNAPGRLRLLPAGRELKGLQGMLARNRYADVPALLDWFDDVEITLIDTPGGLGVFATAGLYAATHVITTMVPRHKELRGALGVVDELRQHDALDRLLGMLFVNADEHLILTRKYRAQLVDAGLPVFDAAIRTRPTMRGDAEHGRPRVLLMPDDLASADFRAVAAEIIERVAAEPTKDVA